jgi:hypothetical protein
LYGVSILSEATVLRILYLPLKSFIISPENESELMVFGESIDKMKSKAKKYLTSYHNISESEVDKMIEHSQSDILSPWN